MGIADICSVAVGEAGAGRVAAASGVDVPAGPVPSATGIVAVAAGVSATEVSVGVVTAAAAARVVTGRESCCPGVAVAVRVARGAASFAID